MKKGDIVLIPFPFTDLSGQKLRPALILVVTEFDLTVSFITTQLAWKEPCDVLVSSSPTSGLKKDSLIRLSKLATIDKGLVVGKIGNISDLEIQNVNANLIALFQLG